MANQNKKMVLHSDEIKAAPRGVPAIEVIDIDATYTQSFCKRQGNW